MDITEIIKNNGTTQIKNPNYNPKAKKNKQPEYLTVPDIFNHQYGITESAVHDYQTQKSIDKPTADKYAAYGLAYDFNKDMDAELAKAQSGWSKLFNGLGQTIWSELTLGTVKAGTDMIGGVIQTPAIILDNMLSSVFNIKNDPVQSTLGMRDNDYSNPISNKLEEWQDYFNNEVAPIYQTPGVDISNGGLTDIGWWASNMPSIMSSLTLLIPTKAATAGAAKVMSAASKANHARKVEKAIREAKKLENLSEVEKVTQATKTGKELNAWQQLIYNPTRRAKLQQAGRIGSEALLMRTIENYQEAHQSYNDMYKTSSEYLNSLSDTEYNDLVDKKKEELGDDLDYTDRDAVAKRIAKKAADRTFLLDYSNTLFDVVQLYALRDVGKLAKNVKSGGVKAAHKASIARAGKTAAQIAEIETKPSTLKSITNKVIDYATGASKMVLSEASEGVEEAVNYIAQQEGITYGNTLLDKESDATFDGFWNKRLVNYLGNSELLESAFWGVMGGVVFGAAGNAYNKSRIKKQNKKEAERRTKIDPLTGEKIQMPKEENDFISMSDMPEVKAAKEAINRRNARLTQLQEDLKLINDPNNPKNPFIEGNPELIGDIKTQQERLNADVIQRFRTDMALDAINSGTFDMLIDYFRSDNVKQALIDADVTSKEDADLFITQTVKDLEDTRAIYSGELSHVNYQVTALNATRREGNTIPLEYVQQIARSNVDKRLRINNLQRQLSRMENMASKVSVDDMNQGDLVHARHTVKLNQLVDAYGRLEADKKAVIADGTLTDWRKSESIDDIEMQQKGIFESIKQMYAQSDLESSSSQALGAILHAIREGASYVKVAPNDYRQNTNDETYRKTDEELIKQYSHIFEGSQVSNETIGTIARKAKADMEAVLGEGGLYDKNSNLFELYKHIGNLETTIGIYSRMIDVSQTQIAKEVDRIHNSRNKVRLELIDKAEKSIRAIHSKYLGTNQEAVEQAVIKAFFDDKREAARIAREGLTGTDEHGKSDAETLLDALNIVNFSHGANREVFRYIASMLHENGERYKRRNQNNSTSQNQSSASENVPTINNTQEGQNADTGQMTDENGQFDIQTSQENLTIKLDDDGEITSITRDNNTPETNTVAAIRHNDGDIELDIDGIENTTERTKYINSKLFKPAGVDQLNEQIELRVQKNPILEETSSGIYKVKEQGIVVGINTETGEIINPDDVEEDADDDVLSSTGDVTDTTMPPIPEPTSAPTSDGTPDTSIANPSDDMIPLLEEQRLQTIRLTLGETFNPSEAVQLEESEINSMADGSVLRTIEQLKEHPLFEGMSESELANMVDDAMNNTVRAVLHIKQLNSGLDRSAAGFALAARYEEPSAVSFSNMFTVAAEAFMKEYAKTNLVPKVDGKYVVNIRDILRICNEASRSAGNTVAREMFEVVKNYLTSEEGEAKYYVLDADDMASGAVLSKITKTTEELQQDNNEYVSQRVNIYDLMDEARRTNDTNYFKVLNSLNSGDTLTMRVGKGTLSFLKGDTIIGTMPTAKLIGDTYYKYNEGWRTDVAMGTDGNIDSEFKDMVIDMFTEDHPDFVKLRELLVKAKLAGQNNISAQLYDEFKNIPFIQDLVNDSILEFENGMDTQPILFVDGNEDDGYYVNTKKAFDHLSKLWNYVTSDINETNLDSKKRVIRRSINTWCSKLYNTYDNIHNQEGDTDVKISYINEGQINRVTNDTINDYNNLPFIRGAMRDISNIRLTIVDYNYDTHISDPSAVSEGPAVMDSGFSKGSTLISVFSRNVKPDFVQAYGCRVDDPAFRSNPMFDKILKATSKALTEALFIWENDNTIENFNKVVDIIKGMFQTQHNTGDIIPLFRGKYKGTEVYINDNIDPQGKGYRGIELVVKRPDGQYHNFKLFNRGSDVNGQPNPITAFKSYNTKITVTNRKNGSIARQGMLALFNILKEDFAINISFDGVKGDNVYSDVNKGFIKRSMVNGKPKVILDIPTSNPELSVREEYDSYNDFIINNDLIRVNTFTGDDGTLFTPRGSNQRKNQVLYVDIPNYKSPVEDITSNNTTSTSNQETYNNLVNIMNSNKHDPGLEILKAIGEELQQTTGSNIFDDLTTYANELGINLNDIFPNDLYYRENLNKVLDDGSFDTKTPLAQAATRFAGNQYAYVKADGSFGWTRLRKGAVVVGPRLLTMLSGPINKKLEGIRKLIHEQIHRLQDQNDANRDAIFKEVDEVYKEFRQLIDEDLANDPTNVGLNYVKNLVIKYEEAATAKLNEARRKLTEATTEEEKAIYQYRIDHHRDVLLAEFMAEAMTNRVMFSYLNSKTLNNAKREENKSLFTKLAELIAKLFGWTINDNSLYAKFMNALNATASGTEEDININNNDEVTNTIEPEVLSETDNDVELNDVSEPIDESRLDVNDDEDEDIYYDDDDDMLSATTEELDFDGFKPIPSKTAMKAKVDIAYQSNFDSLIDNAVIEYKCS